MSQEQVFDYVTTITFGGSNALETGYDPARSYSWDISLQPVSRGFYGYGYGVAFYDIESVGALDYFHVIGVTGTATGYGIASTKGDVIDEFNFGWGYEFSPAIISDNQDTIVVRATVTENNIPIPNVRVVFVGSIGTDLSVETGFTDENGILETIVTVDHTKKNFNLDRKSGGILEGIPINGWANVRAYIDERPQKGDKAITVEVNSTQEDYEQTIYNLVFNSYSFQTYRAYSFA